MRASRRSTPRGGTRRRTLDTIEVHATDPYRNPAVRVRTIEAVKYAWPEWYTKVETADGRVLHWGPWKTEWAARQCARILAVLCSQRGQLTGGVRVE